MTRAWLPVALAVTTVLVVLAGLLHIFAAPPAAPPLPQRVFGVLVAAGAVDAAVLLRHRAAGIAWFASVAAAALAAIEIVGALRGLRLISDATSTPTALGAGIVALLAAATLGLLDALRPRANLVLPDLRRAAVAAESAAAPDPVVAGVRRALDDVERLILARQSIVLEEFGLAAALEWLAERTEQQTALRVELELDGDLVDRRDATRPDVARAAFRIALLALDNTVRHANATAATLRLRVDDASGARLIITDDGHGPPASAGSTGGRGLADMRREASSTGGSVDIRVTPSVTIEARWPAA